MATLFLAKLSGAAGFSRLVAIKVIHPTLAADEQFRQMFLDEALLSSRIQHPNVVHVEELGQHHDVHFLAMEFVHGCSLSQLQRALLGRGRRLAPAFAARIAMHVADALHAAHETRDEQGRLLDVVHRDVTPENVLLSYSGHVKLIDFGIAKAYGRRHRTQDGLLKGKFRYMAPEQALGKSVDRRVDIYQLGIVLWEMLTLRRLFDAERDADLLQSVQHPRIVPPSALVDRIPPALDAAVMAALSENPSQRPPDAQTFARTLARAIPSAHDVDSGALHALLVAAMHEQRQRDRRSYPRGVYDRLDQLVETQPLASAERGGEGAPAILARHTIEHTAPCGSDVQPEAVATAAGSSQKPAANGLFRQRQRQRRPRRKRQLARFSGAWRTALTYVVRDSFVGSRMFWLSVGSAIGLAGALALITLGMRNGRHVGVYPPALPQASAASLLHATNPADARGAAEPAPASRAAALPAPGQPGSAFTAPDAAIAPPARPRPAAPAQGSSRATQRIVVVDGTPLATDPGF